MYFNERAVCFSGLSIIIRDLADLQDLCNTAMCRQFEDCSDIAILKNVLSKGKWICFYKMWLTSFRINSSSSAAPYCLHLTKIYMSKLCCCSCEFQPVCETQNSRQSMHLHETQQCKVSASTSMCASSKFCLGQSSCVSSDLHLKLLYLSSSRVILIFAAPWRRYHQI